MALTKQEIARMVLRHLSVIGVNLNEEEKDTLETDNIITIEGQVYKAPNVMSSSLYNVNVNKRWFSDRNNKDKPSFRSKHSRPPIEFDFLLFPAKNSLFMVPRCFMWVV
ncbi:MAG: hypothetical protein JRD69_03465 [Deltaproteobacteria bacterium]|nr:hypothetical protein [Deltaproteobacteria bacterium]